MKKKVLATTVAASLTFSAFAGLPLSNKGLFEKIGISTAYAATDIDDVATRLQQYRAFLWDDATEKQPIRDARAKLKAIDDVALVQPLTDKIGQDISSAKVLNLFASLGLFFNTNKEAAYDYLNDPVIRQTLNDLANKAHTDLNDPQLTIDEAIKYALAVQDSLLTQISKKSLAQLAALAVDENKMKVEIKAAIKKVMDDPNNYFSTVLKGVNPSNPINEEDVADVAMNLINEADPEHKALENIALSVLRYEAATSVGNVVESGTSGSTSFTFDVMGQKVPAAILDWSFEPANGNAAISYDENTGKVTASTKTEGTYTGEIYARIQLVDTLPLHNKVLLKKEITLSYDDGSSGGTGGGGGGTPSNPTSPQVDTVNKELDNAAKELEKLDAAGKKAYIDNLAAKAAQALEKAATIDLSGKVTVTGDKAELKLDAAALVKQIQALAEQAKQLTDKLKALGANTAGLKVELKLSLGNINAKSVAVPLAKDILAAAQSNGVAHVKVEFNGIGVALSPDAFKGDTTLDVQNLDASVATAATDLPVASVVLDFTITVDGKVVSTFSEPVQLSLPIKDASKFDKEKLTLAKIVDGALVIYGGMYDADTNQLTANRSGFSSYTVVENNVTFDDTASVKTWAGRQIEVAAAKGIVEGRADKQFVPNDTVTRAEFAKMIINTFGLDVPNAAESFDDVNDSDWFKPYVASAVKHGLVNGRSEGQFDPNGKITRAEMATIAARALIAVKDLAPVADADAALKAFNDSASINASLKAGVALSASQGIIVGEEGGAFNPNANSTRAQAAVVIYRLLNK
ncbi:S-layer homology domain-containing protein [Paenibacillus validus]|uniref:S-layer homology domain-containing protein n=1 Tax=Paenibacillus validus TaxID=44253 RepID=UPI000FDC60A1|nr:S-layer homology domain-containing protein [Paenibacillus validus]MED4600747.1 S-layer homology domain-containing protein [Paenibacillus validus]MED4606182.1 S-layer homology domain-containing protein [Paenibacillus validus]